MIYNLKVARFFITGTAFFDEMGGLNGPGKTIGNRQLILFFFQYFKLPGNAGPVLIYQRNDMPSYSRVQRYLVKILGGAHKIIIEAPEYFRTRFPVSGGKNCFPPLTVYFQWYINFSAFLRIDEFNWFACFLKAAPAFKRW